MRVMKRAKARAPLKTAAPGGVESFCGMENEDGQNPLLNSVLVICHFLRIKEPYFEVVATTDSRFFALG